MTEILEDCFFFYNRKGEHLYGCIYIPKSNMLETGLVIVPPVGHERLRCYRECVTLARELAQAGYPVLRFDYRGEGESFGIFEEFDVGSRLEDISLAVNELKNRISAQNIYLLGFRLGAIFSLMAVNDLNCKHIILCEPIFDVKKYVHNLIRVHIILVREYFSNFQIKSGDIIKKLKKGESISVYGFHLKGRYLQQLENIDVGKFIEQFQGNSYILSFSKKDIGNIVPMNLSQWYDMFNISGKCNYIPVQTSFSWITKKTWTDRIDNLADRVIFILKSWE